jgi:hypothetical protein
VEGYTEKGVLFYENLDKKEEGKKILEEAVNKGSSTAAFELGAKYLIEKNYKEAVDLGEKEFASERLQDIGNK